MPELTLQSDRGRTGQVKQAMQRYCVRPYIPTTGNRIPRRKIITEPSMYTMKYPPPNTMRTLMTGWSFLNLVADLLAFVK